MNNSSESTKVPKSRRAGERCSSYPPPPDSRRRAHTNKRFSFRAVLAEMFFGFGLSVFHRLIGSILHSSLAFSTPMSSFSYLSQRLRFPTLRARVLKLEIRTTRVRAQRQTEGKARESRRVSGQNRRLLFIGMSIPSFPTSHAARGWRWRRRVGCEWHCNEANRKRNERFLRLRGITE